MIQLRSLRTGTVTRLPADMSVEITDKQGNIALLVLADLRQEAVTLVTQADEPQVAGNYEKTYNVKFSRVLAPDLSTLTRAPTPSTF